MKKGQQAFWLHLEITELGARAGITRVTIESWGKKRGTALRMDTGDMAKVAFYTDGDCTVFVTEADAKAFAESTWKPLCQDRRNGSLRCDESVLNRVKPQYRQGVLDRMEKLRNAPMELIWDLKPRS